NPYVTVDYLENVPTNDGAVADAWGPHLYTPVAQRASYGRRQPYAAYVPLGQGKQQPLPALVDQPQHSFFSQNVPPQAPFDWLVHLDRPLQSPIELLHVSAFKPHELTQQFRTAAGPFQHTAEWWLPERRLYRAFEFLETHSLVAGAPAA